MSIFQDIANKLLGSKDKTPGTPLAPVSQAIDQSLDEIKLVEYIREKIDTVRQNNSRIALEGIYLTNIAYLLGFDGVYYDTTYRQFKNTDPKRKITRNRFKVNKILPTVQNRLARLTQSPPRYDVRPNSNSTKDKDSARLGLEVLNDLFEKQHFSEKRQEMLMACMAGGVAYLQGSWDPTLGKPIVDPETGEFNGEYEGDWRLEPLNCLEVFPDPLAKTLDDCQYIIKAKVRKLEYFREKYPDRGGAVREEDAWLLSSIYDMKSNALTAVGIVGASTQDQMKNSAIELVYYEKRSKDYPRGRMVVAANGVLLADKELPIGEFDIVKFDDILVGSRYNSEAVITHLRPIQDQYNITRTKCAEWVRKMLAGKYLAAKGAGLSQEAINNESGEVVEYNPVTGAEPPTPMTVPMIPQYVYKDLEQLDNEFNQIIGLNDVSQGTLPSASIPAAGMAFLQEQDQTRIGVQTTRNEASYARLGQIALKYVCKNYELPRLLKIAGDGLEYTVKDFVGQDINDNTDVTVVPGSTIPTSKVLRRQDITNAYQMGILGNPTDPKVQAKVLEMMEYGDIQDAWKKQALTAARCKKIIHDIETSNFSGLKGMLSEFDNQAQHLDMMDDYRLTDKYLAFDEKQKAVFDGIMEWRLQSLSNTTNPQISQNINQAEQMVQNVEAIAPPGAGTDMSGGQVPPPPIQEPQPPPQMM